MMEKEALTNNIADDLAARNRNWTQIDDLSTQVDANTNDIVNKVDKVTGKSLVNDTEIARLANVDNYDDAVVQQDLQSLKTNKADKSDTYTKSEINSKTGSLTTSISTLNNEVVTARGEHATLGERLDSKKEELANKVDKVEGKDLSTNDYIDADKQKLANIQAEANKTVISNNLNETTLGRALDATQGKVLKDEINLVDGEVTSLGDSFDSHKEEFDLHKEDYNSQKEDFNSHKLDYANLVGEVSQIKRVIGINTIDSWRAVQEIVRQGKASEYFNVGDQFIANYNGTPYTWDVIGINHDTPTDTSKQYSLTIQTHDCIMNCQFDAPEALYYAEAELPAGTYHFLNNYEADKSYQLALTNAVPAGGIIFISGWETNSPTQIKSFADSTTTNEIETIAIIEGSGGTQLSTINDIRRCQYGSSNYIESNIRQWLNSQDSSFIWDRTTNYSKPSTAAPYAGGGFLSLLDPELVEVIGAVDKQVARNTRTDGGGQDLFSDKVFPLSRKEVFGGDEGAVTGEIPYPWYSALAANPTVDPLTGRIKYLSGSARYWWLRSPYTGHSYHPRIVHTTGNVNSTTVRATPADWPPLVASCRIYRKGY